MSKVVERYAARDLADLKKIIDDIPVQAHYERGDDESVDPATIYLRDLTPIELVVITLSDGSKVFEVVIGPVAREWSHEDLDYSDPRGRLHRT